MAARGQPCSVRAPGAREGDVIIDLDHKVQKISAY